MLNKQNLRELAYAVTIEDIQPIIGADKVESARIGGWQSMVPKGRFKKGDAAIYFEIDSRLPQTEPFAFMANKGYKVKTQKYTFGGKNPNGYYSQGLLLHPEDLGAEWRMGFAPTQPENTFIENTITHEVYIPNDLDSMFMTEVLGVTYATAEDRKRKGNDLKDVDKYKKMANKLGPRMKKPIIKWLFKFGWGKKLLYFWFRKELKTNSKKFPNHLPYVRKTDQERVENLPYETLKHDSWIETEKCDGTSSTYILERKKKGYEYYVCSRSVRQLDRNQENYHSKVDGENNVYWDMSDKYNIPEIMKSYMDEHLNLDYMCIQGETCGPKLQGNPHKLKENHLFVFHIITSDCGRWDMTDVKTFCDEYRLECVPITNLEYHLPPIFEDFKAHADGNYSSSVVGKGTKSRREGYVYYAKSDPNRSFKNVSREYLAKKK